MSHRIIYSKNAVRDIQNLDKVAKRKLKLSIDRYAVNPLYYARKMVSSTIGQYRWRAGNYRIIFDLSGRNILILRVGHRREIYRKY